MFKCILAAIDNSDRTDRVMEVVGHLAQTTGAAVHLVHADEAEAVYDQVVDLEDDRSARSLVDREVAQLRSAGIVATGDVMDVLHEDVAELVLTRAREFGSDLIVLAPRHHSRFAALLGSSISLEVALHSPTSVLLVA
ncbi:nucleotide-binding universal stress UspA family protein [Kribbella pratensis]|uniref:Nucleotide-binding universal stress UspA family protein n=1 Tax=Kribbella pratensis TaxID=2512112 RepID=A0ABY2FJZ1_9ACTN|nr:universal stress protein [Kribbella pratensis]TDW93440.1 nucleotide-binding universal stress UspA family protein [Kribbella pratensis]